MGLLELNLSVGQIQTPLSTMLCFPLQFIILILALKMYFVLMSITARDNGNLAEEMAFAMFSFEFHI